MNTPIAFIRRHLDPVDRLGEVLFGLIMALGFTSACRLGLAQPDNRDLLIGISGCNLAWAFVDGAMHTLASLFERGRRARLFRMVAQAKTEADAFELIDRELRGRLETLATDHERERIYRWVLEAVQRGKHEQAWLSWGDALGGVAVGLLIVVATVPVVIPFLLFRNADVAVRVSELMAIGLLFWIGCWWGREVGSSPLRIG
ncbi:MAG: VIT family protein, partial [Planctomycetes bacterium]|nr:VIT family protein [Planctomycetota bacterium]